MINRLTLLLLGIIVLGLVAVFVGIEKMGGWQFLWYRLQNRGLTEQYEHRKNLFEMLPESKGKIVFLGDSLTEQCEWSELLQRTDILNRGISGDQTAGLLARLDQIIELQPRQIFLMIGVNDLFFVDSKELLRQYQQILERLQTELPETKLILQSILPVNPDIRTITIDNKTIRKTNEGIQKLAKAKNIPFLSLHTHFTDENGQLKSSFTADGIHLNGKGYQLWKSHIEEYLMPFVD